MSTRVTNPAVQQAIALLVQYTLATAASPESGVWMDTSDLNLNGIDVGSWRIDVRRTKQP